MKITYEQCPWDEKHVLSLYRNIKVVEAEGRWHPISVERGLAIRTKEGSQVFAVLSAAALLVSS
jgi:hypothetical protein